MPSPKFPRCVAGLVCAITCLPFLGWLPHAAAQTPTADQIEIFQNLPPDQQQAILDSLNRSGTQGPLNRPRADR